MAKHRGYASDEQESEQEDESLRSEDEGQLESGDEDGFRREGPRTAQERSVSALHAFEYSREVLIHAVHAENAPHCTLPSRRSVQPSVVSRSFSTRMARSTRLTVSVTKLSVSNDRVALVSNPRHD